jgi:hypothetical protein
MNKMKKLLSLITVLATTVLISGCQIPGKVLAEKQSPNCPTCNQVVTTGPIKGTTNTTMHCPSCKTTYVDESYDEIQDKRVIHSCSHCGINVKECKQCAAASK